MSFAERCFAAARPVWDAQAAHPFVRGIADGTLPEERFRRWVRQDYLYLVEFSRVLAYGAGRADRLESMTWYADVLHLTLMVEMDLHRRFAARFGISEEELESEPVWPTTRTYTEFLIQTAAAGERADLPAVLLPCEWGYLHLADGLAAEGTPEDARYAEWIEQYTSNDYRAAVDWLKAELDRLAVALDDAGRDRLEDLFLTSSRYELAFWDMCWHGEEPR